MPIAEEKSVARRNIATQRRSKDKVQRILDTTLAMLSAGPADKITTNEIAKNAGISIGTLYHYFPKKEAIFYELFRRWLQQTLDLLDGVDARFDGSENLEDYVDAIFERLSRDEEINSPGHWQLRRAMGSSRELAELEAHHQKEVTQRLISFQKRFGREISEQQAGALAYLQNQVSVACLSAAALYGSRPEGREVLQWCRKTLHLVYDIERLSDKL